MKRFFIMTIEARRYINPLLTLIGTGIYSLDCSTFNFYKIEVDGVVGSLKTTDVVIGDALYTYYYNSSTKILHLRLNASDLTNKKNFIVTHLIAVTNIPELNWNIEPDSPNTRKIIFESRLVRAPEFGQQQENNLNGTLTLSSSTIELKNNDLKYNKFFTSNDSFKSCTVKAWKCKGDVTNRELVYIGTVSRATSGTTLKLSTEDILNRLDKVLYSRSTYESSLAGSRSGVPDNQKEIPIRRIYGRNSYFKYKYETVNTEALQRVLDPNTMPEAFCINFDPTPSTTVNRQWETGVLEDRVGMEDFAVVSSALSVGTGAGLTGLLLQLNSNRYDEFSIGDTFETEAGQYGKITEVTSNSLYVTPNTLTPMISIFTNKVSSLIVTAGGVDYQLFYKRDYTVSAPATDAPIKITLVDNFEANVGMPQPIDPTKDRMVYKIRNVSGRASYSHGAQIKKIILSEFSSSEINTTSFDNADTDLDLDLCFMVPDMSGEFPTKRSLIQGLVVSAFGYLYLGDDFKINYGNFKLPSANEELTDVEVKKETIEHSVDYDDIYESIAFKSDGFSETLTFKSDQATYLHKTNKKKDYNHLCDVVSIVKPVAHFKKITQIISMKRVISQMGIYEIPTRIGLEFNLNFSKKLGNQAGAVLSLENTDQETTIRVAQLESAQGNVSYILNGSPMGNI